MHSSRCRSRRESGQRSILAAARLITLLALLAILPHPGFGQELGADTVKGVVQVEALIPGDARTASSLGTERVGTGVLIDHNGLIVTIGYLVLEASEVTVSGAGQDPVPATILAYDHESGFGLIRANSPLKVAPVSLGNSTALRPMQPLLVVSHAGELDATGVYLVDRREFAGYWEYLLEDALFTSPPHAKFGGAALIDEGGRLVGIGSLFVHDAGRDAGAQGRTVPGNMFVPIDGLKAIMGDLLSRGRRADPGRPWLGLSMEEHRGRVFVTRVSPDGPAEAAGIKTNDMILGIDGVPVHGLGDLYRKLWSRGEAGVKVPLDVLQGTEVRPVIVESADRYRYLRLDPSF
jgi:S1-C subfamily serine protease